MDYRNLHNDRLSTTDEHGHRIYVHPEKVKGKWRDLRTYFYSFLTAIYLFLPWIHMGGKQIVRLDILHREFHFFGYTFYGHDAPLLIFILLGFTLSFAIISSLWGRVWCGWACPQTVFIDLIFRRIDRLVEGNSIKQTKLDQMPWNKEKITKRSVKWFLFTIVSLHLAHTFLGYFWGTRELLLITLENPTAHLTEFFTMLFITGIILFDFGWFREQFCLIACPYGRIQSVAMDEDSLVVGYDFNRGEPRKGQVLEGQTQGDCVNCYQCVRVCPTGIDIRRGTQLECIHCTMCIDACDDIMKRLKKPTGLIRYTTENELNKKPARKINPRIIIYSVLLLVVIVGFIYSLINLNKLKIHMVRGSTTPFQTLVHNQGVEVINHYKAIVHHYEDDHQKVELVSTNDKVKLVTPLNPVELKKGVNKINIFFKFDKAQLTEGNLKYKFHVNDGKKVLKEVEVNLVGPLK
jgi:cytochrome c oxidase accessory protein FixG